MATLGSKTWDWGLLLTGLPLCVATRAANIFPLSHLANLRRKLPLPRNLQVGSHVHLLMSRTWALFRRNIMHLGPNIFPLSRLADLRRKLPRPHSLQVRDSSLSVAQQSLKHLMGQFRFCMCGGSWVSS